MYESGKSIPEVSKETGIPLSTLRFRFYKAGILRSRSDAVRLAGKNGRLGSGMRGKKRSFSDEWKANISKAKTGVGVGFTKKQSGYIEITMGVNKGRGAHVVIMEEEIGRRLFATECVHHKDKDKSNNKLSNLKLMTRSEHARLHALENEKTRNRQLNGRFI
jgi:hypothetical protein